MRIFKNFNIKTKIMILAIVGLLFMALVVFWELSSSAKKELKESQMHKLSALETAVEQRLNSYFEHISKILINTSSLELTTLYTRELDRSFKELKNQYKDNSDIKTLLIEDINTHYLPNINSAINNYSKKEAKDYTPLSDNGKIAQYLFITNNPNPIGEKQNYIYDEKLELSYMDIHQKAHLLFQSIVKNNSFYDIFLINNDGDIIYTYFKERDFGTNLLNGAYSKTSLAKVFKKATKIAKNKVVFEDYEFYEPSLNKPASFVAIPIFDKENNRLGVLAIQLPTDQIDNIINFNKQ